MAVHNFKYQHLGDRGRQISELKRHLGLHISRTAGTTQRDSVLNFPSKTKKANLCVTDLKLLILTFLVPGWCIKDSNLGYFCKASRLDSGSVDSRALKSKISLHKSPNVFFKATLLV